MAQHVKLRTHAGARKINGLDLKGAPAHWVCIRVHEHMIDSPHIIALRRSFLNTFALQEPYLGYDAGFVRPQQFLSDPAEYPPPFQKPVRACCA
jgi:hypothetical protein